MQENLIQAGCLVFIIFAGYLLRRTGFFKEGDFSLLSRIVLKITLPAAIISNFSGKELDPALLALVLVGFVPNLIYLIAGFLAYRRQGREKQAFSMLNLTGYNIGNFVMPFVQNFLGATGVITASLMDVGNAMFSLGGAYGVAAQVKENSRFSVRRLVKALFSAVAFDTYLVMTVLSLLRIQLPGAVLSLADIVGRANIFLGMLMLGVGLRLPDNKAQLGQVARILVLRYGLATVFALIAYFVLPFALPVRQAAVIVLFSSLASAATPFTGELRSDVGLSGAINSLSVICSVVIITVLTTVIL